MTQQTPVEHYPFDAKVSVDAETNQRLISNLSERFSQPRLNVHVSDLDLCLRQSVFKKVAPKPVTGKELGFFSAGRGHHDCLEGLHGAEREVAREWEGIKAHYDLLDKTVLEIKTTRSFNRNVAPHYIRRLAYYLAIEGQLLGKLIIMYLMPVRASKKNPKPPQDFIETYNVRFPDLEVIRTDLRNRRDCFLKAWDMKNPSLAPSVLNDPELKWLCKNCQYHRECDEEEKAKDTAEKAEYEERIVVEKAMVDSTLDEAEDQ